MPMHRRTLMLALAACCTTGSVLAQTPTTQPQVKLHTSLGDIVVHLEPEHAPATVRSVLH